jgi:integrase
MTKKPTTHGGRRDGAGRPKGRKTKNPKGKIAVSRTVSMHPHSWDKLDRLRGDTPRGKYIEQKLFPSTKGKKYELVMDFSTNTLHGLPV